MSKKIVDSLKAFSDVELVCLVKQGNEFAFEEITIRYLSLINNLAKQFYTSGYDLNDFIQEGLLGLLSACKTYDEKSGVSLRGYIRVCVKNVFISVVRKGGSKSEIPTDRLVSLNDVDISAFGKESNEPEELLLNKEHLNGLLSQLKNDLSTLEWDVLTLYIAGYSYSEIAKKLDVTLKSVDNAVQRIKKKRTI